MTQGTAPPSEDSEDFEDSVDSVDSGNLGEERTELDLVMLKHPCENIWGKQRGLGRSCWELSA